MALAATVMLVGACGGNNDSSSTPDVPTVTPATASPAPSGPGPAPDGLVVPVPAGSADVVASGARVAILGADRTSVLLRSGAQPDAASASVTTPPLNAIAAGADGGFVGAGSGAIVRIGPDNRVTTHPIASRDVLSVASAPDERILVGTADGHLLVYSPGADGAQARLVRDIGGFVRVDEITVSPAADHQVVVLDRAQSSVTPVDLADGTLGAALRAGNGATNSTVDRYGRVLVANTRDGEILGFYGQPLVMRFRYPVSGGPYAVDYDDTRNLLWVSTTANNEVVAYDLSSGEPTERFRHATVGQPDSITVDSSGALYVLSARSGQLQIIAPG